MWGILGGLGAGIAFLIWWFRQGAKSMIVKLLKDDRKKTRQIQKDWAEIDANRKEQNRKIADDPAHDPGSEWE